MRLAVSAAVGARTQGGADEPEQIGVKKLPGLPGLRTSRGACKMRCEANRCGSPALPSACHGAYYLAAIPAILKSGVETGGQVGALLVFNPIAFSAAETPLVSIVIAPDATRARLDQLYEWVTTDQRLVIPTLAGIVGVYLPIMGISKL